MGCCSDYSGIIMAKSFIEKLDQCQLNDSNMRNLRDMLIGTYQGYQRNNKEDTLETIIKLSYLLGKEVGKEELRNNSWKRGKEK